jgi:uncharacterized protein YehS (DUF1456 family)
MARIVSCTSICSQFSAFRAFKLEALTLGVIRLCSFQYLALVLFTRKVTVMNPRIPQQQKIIWTVVNSSVLRKIRYLLRKFNFSPFCKTLPLLRVVNCVVNSSVLRKIRYLLRKWNFSLFCKTLPLLRVVNCVVNISVLRKIRYLLRKCNFSLFCKTLPLLCVVNCVVNSSVLRKIRYLLRKCNFSPFCKTLPLLLVPHVKSIFLKWTWAENGRRKFLY